MGVDYLFNFKSIICTKKFAVLTNTLKITKYTIFLTVDVSQPFINQF